MLIANRTLLVALLICTAAPLSAAPVANGIALFGGRLYPTLGVDQRHESNYLRTPNQTAAGIKLEPLSTWITILRPKLTWSSFSGERAARAYRLEYEANIGTVQAARDNDYIDQRFNTSGNWEVNLTNRFRAEYEFLRWSDRRGSGDPDDVSRINFQKHPDLWKSNRFEAGWSIGRPGPGEQGGPGDQPGRSYLMDLWATTYARRYINNNQYMRDNDRITLNATLSRVVLPKTRGLVQLWWQDIDYIRERPGIPTKDSQERKYYLGALWDISRKSSLSARGGYLGKDFEDPSRKDIGDFGWELDFRWRPQLERMVLDLSTKRLPRESAELLSDSTLITSYEVNWLHHIRTDRIWYEIGGWYTNDEYVGTPRDDHRWYARTALYGRMWQRVLLGLEYQHEQRDSNLREAEYNNDVVQLTLEVPL